MLFTGTLVLFFEYPQEYQIELKFHLHLYEPTFRNSGYKSQCHGEKKLENITLNMISF